MTERFFLVRARGEQEPTLQVGGDMSVLVADDEPAIRELVQDILEMVGVRVCLATSGSEALTCMQTVPLALAILDVQMPAPDGLSLLQQIRAAGNSLPVLMMTAYPTPDLRTCALQYGAVEFLSKPFDPTHLLTMVELVLGKAAGT